MFSVITPTIRKKGLDLVELALKRQVVKSFEWLIGSPFNPDAGVWVKDDFKGGVWTLNRIYNKLIKTSKYDFILSIQDHTYFDYDAIRRFSAYADGLTIVSGVGNKYERVVPELRKELWRDPRIRGRSETYDVPFNEIEGNFCMVPKQAFYEVGGFNEAMDYEGYGMDFFNVLERISKLGKYRFIIDETIKSYSETHGRVKDWEEKNLIHNYKTGEVKLNYL